MIFKVKAEINAETYSSISDSFTNLAIVLADTEKLQKKLLYVRSITDHKMRDKQIVLFVFSQLKEKGSWCLLFDNVDNFNSIIDFIPHNNHMHNDGKVIITTRNENLKNTEIFPEYCVINIPLLTVSEQEVLFSRIIHSHGKLQDEEISKMKVFLRNIPLMPLDVCAAAYYIKNTHISFEEYLKITNNPNINPEKMHSIFLATGINYDKTRYGIVSSIFEKIIKINPDFKELLLFICLLDSQDIPRSYLEKYKNQETVQEFMHNLNKYSLITKKDNTFSIHRSTQEIGLKYVLSLLSENEKAQYIDKIIKIMTPYECMIWELYAKQEKRMTLLEIKNLVMHIERLLKNIDNVSTLNNKEEYKTKLLLARFYAYANIKQESATRTVCEEIIKLNQNDRYIQGYDLAVLLIMSVTLYLDVGDFFDENIEEIRLNKALSICSTLSNADNLTAYCFMYLSRIHCERGDFNKCLKDLEKSKFIIERCKKETWSLPTKAILCHQYYNSFSNHYVIRKGINESINLFLETLREFGAEELFYKSKSKPPPYFVPSLRMNLAAAYNRLEQYDKALESEKEAEFLYEKRRKSGVAYSLLEYLIQIEKSHTLLRLNDVENAHNNLEKAIEAKRNLKDFRKMLDA